MWVFSQHSEVINNGLQMCYLSQHGDLYILEAKRGWSKLNCDHKESKKSISAYISAIYIHLLGVIKAKCPSPPQAVAC